MFLLIRIAIVRTPGIPNGELMESQHVHHSVEPTHAVIVCDVNVNMNQIKMSKYIDQK